MASIADKLYISTIAEDAGQIASAHSLGLEIAEFCTAFNMDMDYPIWDAKVRASMIGVRRLVFHAPFNELCPAAVDPMIIDVSKKRYEQAYGVMSRYGIDVMIVHSGMLEFLYEKNWFIEKSIVFWKSFLVGKPDSFRLYIENVFESAPDVLIEIVRGIGDERCKLCLDIGHGALSGGASPLTAWVEVMAPLLSHVHVHNNYGERDSHNTPGDGSISVTAIMRLIMEKAPEATFTIEAVDAGASVDWLISEGFLG